MAGFNGEGRSVQPCLIDYHKCHKDSGRVLGYDSAHGYHHRHRMGTVEAIEFPGYQELLTRFCKEVSALCKKAKA